MKKKFSAYAKTTCWWNFTGLNRREMISTNLAGGVCSMTLASLYTWKGLFVEATTENSMCGYWLLAREKSWVWFSCPVLWGGHIFSPPPQWRHQKFFRGGESRGKMRYWGGKNPNICQKWLILTIFFFWLGGQVGGRASDWGGKCPHAPPWCRHCPSLPSFHTFPTSTQGRLG